MNKKPKITIYLGLLIVLSFTWGHVAKADTRVNTVEFFGGQYSSTTAQNDSTVNAFPEQAFKLSETSVSIKDAYIEISLQLGFGTSGATASPALEALLYFDACNEPCTPSPVVKLDTAKFSSPSVESEFAVVRASVSSEPQLLAYTGGGASLSFQVSYCVDGTDNSACSGAANVFTQAANAKLVITYTYDDTSTTLTNTVIYPVASASDIGSKPTTTATCTMDTSCPKFYYNADIPEFTSNAASRSQFFLIQRTIDAATSTDNTLTPQIDGSATGTGVTWEEIQSGNGGWARYYFAGLAGYANNTAQRLEIAVPASGSMMLGGEDYVTYTYPSSAATKTKTVVYSVGELTTNCSASCTALSPLKGPNVFFAEKGVVVKKAWFRVQTSSGTTILTRFLDIVTKVGNNAQTASTAYKFTADARNINEDGYLIHIIPSADYAEMGLANENTGKRVQIAADWDVTGAGAMSAELVITYQYTDDTAGYMQTQMLFAGQSSVSAALTFSTSQGRIDPVFPEASGTRLIRTASLRTDAIGHRSAADPTIGSKLAIGSCTATATTTTDTRSDPNMISLFDSTASASMTTSDSQTYTACYISDTLKLFTGTLTITYQINKPRFNQSAYRLFTNDNATTVTTALANQDTAGTLTSDAQIFRLRMLVHVASGSLAVNGNNFKLQAAKQSGTCDTAFSGETYADIGSGTSISYDTSNTPADGDSLTVNTALDPNHSHHATKSQSYEEANNFSNSVSAIASGQDGLWDFALKDNDGDSNDVFCIRAVRSTGTLFTVGSGSYSVIPQITMAAAGAASTFTQSAFRFFENNNSNQIGGPLASINASASINTQNGDFRLRLAIDVSSADLGLSGQDFKLQFAGKGAGSCTSPSGTPSSYTDITTTTSISYKNNDKPADSDPLYSNDLDPQGTGVQYDQTYEEANNFTNSIQAINTGAHGLWDFSLQDSDADDATAFCLRAVKSSGTTITYSVYPQIRTFDVATGVSGVISRGGGGGSIESSSGGSGSQGGGTGENAGAGGTESGSGGSGSVGGGGSSGGGGGASPVLFILWKWLYSLLNIL